MEKALLTLFFILLAAADAAKDAIREGNYPFADSFKDWTKRQRIWHALKAFGLYTPIALLMYRADFDFCDATINAVAGLFVWRIVYDQVRRVCP